MLPSAWQDANSSFELANTQSTSTARSPVVTPLVSIVIVNYHQWPDTARLVQQLGASSALSAGSIEIVLVDNHSPSHPLLSWLQRQPGVSVRRWGRNRGFAQAVNEGWRLSQGRWLLLLNPDVTVPTDFLDRLQLRLRELEETAPHLGIVGFKLTNTDGSPQLSTGLFPSLGSTLRRLLLPRSRRKYLEPQGDECRSVPWVTGCCLLVRRDCLQSLGGLDPSFFLYYEDVDLCKRAHELGWQIAYDPSVTIRHHQPLHSREVTPKLRFLTRHALLNYARKHWPGWQQQALAGVIQFEAYVRQHWARWRDDLSAMQLFRALGRLAGHARRSDWTLVERCLQQVVRRAETGP